jgi:hypothetical protein
MADIVFNPVAGAPFSGGVRMKDLGDNTFAPLSMSIAGFQPVASLVAQSAIQSGVMLDNTGVRNNHSLVVTCTAGVTAGGVVQLWGSQDNVNWFGVLNNAATPVIVAITTTTAGVVVTNIATAVLTPIRYLRAQITTAISGGTITAYVASAG